MVGGQLPPGVGVGVGVPPPGEPSIATVMRASGMAMLPLGLLGLLDPLPLAPWCSTTSPKATAEVRLVSGVTVIVSSCVSSSPPLNLKLDGETSTVKPGVIAVPVAVQLVADVTVLRTVRVNVQLGVHSMLRTDGVFKVLGSPPVLGLASRKCWVVSSITSPARAALLSSILHVPTSSASHGVVPSCLLPPLNEVIIRADFTSWTVQSLWTARTNAAEPELWGVAIDVPLMVPYAPRLIGNAA